MKPSPGRSVSITVLLLWYYYEAASNASDADYCDRWFQCLSVCLSRMQAMKIQLNGLRCCLDWRLLPTEGTYVSDWWSSGPSTSVTGGGRFDAFLPNYFVHLLPHWVWWNLVGSILNTLATRARFFHHLNSIALQYQVKQREPFDKWVTKQRHSVSFPNITKIRNIHFVGNLILSTGCEFYYVSSVWWQMFYKTSNTRLVYEVCSWQRKCCWYGMTWLACCSDDQCHDCRSWCFWTNLDSMLKNETLIFNI